MEVTLTSKCQLTLPSKVREHLHVHEGDRLSFIIKEDGEVIVRPKKEDWRNLIGLFHHPGDRPVTDRQIDQAVDEGMKAEWEAKQKRQVRK